MSVADHVVSFYKDFAIVKNQRGQVRLTADREGDLYYVREEIQCAAASSIDNASELMKWHERLGHLNIRDLLKVVGEAKFNNIGRYSSDVLQCEICLKGKMTTLPFSKGSSPCTELLKIIHSGGTYSRAITE